MELLTVVVVLKRNKLPSVADELASELSEQH